MLRVIQFNCKCATKDNIDIKQIANGNRLNAVDHCMGAIVWYEILWHIETETIELSAVTQLLPKSDLK